MKMTDYDVVGMDHESVNHNPWNRRRYGDGASAGPWQEAGPMREEARPRSAAGGKTGSRHSQDQWTM